MIIDKCYQVELACSDDEGRPHLNQLHLDREKGELCATTGQILACVPVTDISEDADGWISPEALKAARKTGMGLHANGALKVIGGPTFPRRGQETAKFPPDQPTASAHRQRAVSGLGRVDHVIPFRSALPF